MFGKKKKKNQFRLNFKATSVDTVLCNKTIKLRLYGSIKGDRSEIVFHV